MSDITVVLFTGKQRGRTASTALVFGMIYMMGHPIRIAENLTALQAELLAEKIEALR